MRYKDLVTVKLENLGNTLRVLDSLLSQNAPRHTIIEWFNDTKERIEEIQTLINVETQD